MVPVPTGVVWCLTGRTICARFCSMLGRTLGNNLRRARVSLTGNPNQEVTMKRIAITAAVLAATAFSAIGTAAAQGVEMDVGRGGVFVGERHDHDRFFRHRHFRETFGFGGECRVVVRTHINRFGERVSVRRRICD